MAVPSVFRHQLSSGSSFFWRSFVTVYSGSSFSLSLLAPVSEPIFLFIFPGLLLRSPLWFSSLATFLAIFSGHPFWLSFPAILFSLPLQAGLTGLIGLTGLTGLASLASLVDLGC